MLKKILQWRPILTNVYARGILVFVAMCISDFIWAKYIFSVAEGLPFIAATWGTIVVVLGAFITISYIQDRRLIIPAAIGAFIGTYLAL